MYLNPNQFLYKIGDNDQKIYIILFGRLQIQKLADGQPCTMGRVNLGWTLGEEILFDRTLQTRSEQVFAESDTCLIAISKQKLAIL